MPLPQYEILRPTDLLSPEHLDYPDIRALAQIIMAPAPTGEIEVFLGDSTDWGRDRSIWTRIDPNYMQVAGQHELDEETRLFLPGLLGLEAALRGVNQYDDGCALNDPAAREELTDITIANFGPNFATRELPASNYFQVMVDIQDAPVQDYIGDVLRRAANEKEARIAQEP